MRMAAFLSPFLLIFSRLGRPVIWLLEKVAGFLVSLLPGYLQGRRHILMEEEFKTLIDVGEKKAHWNRLSGISSIRFSNWGIPRWPR